jgi:hypothetical protein
MKQNKTFVAFITGLSIITIVSLATINHAQAATAVVKTTTAVTTESKESKTPIEGSPLPNGFFTSVKIFASNIYNKVDTWRKGQETTWRALKTEKQEEVKARDAKMDQGLKDRENKVLEGEQASIVQGSVKDFDWHIFLIKIYIAALTVFVFIFAYPIAFYGVIIVIVFSILRRLYQRTRYGY